MRLLYNDKSVNFGKFSRPSIFSILLNERSKREKWKFNLKKIHCGFKVKTYLAKQDSLMCLGLQFFQ
jgi:hypothetical protein